MRLLLLASLICFGFNAAASEFNSKAEYAIAVDNQTGMVLYEKKPDEKMHPSSMTKLMTLYILFDNLKSGKITKETKFKVSEKAWKMGGSKMFVHVGNEITVEDLIRGIIVQSGNDACVVVAENISGTEESFAVEMNKYAEKLGLKNSHFKNSTGMPDPEHLMTARDLDILGQKLIKDFPEYYNYFSEKEFVYNKIKQPNRNLLLYRNIEVDGLKTGHTEEAGYGIVASAIRGDRRVTVVVNGLDGEKQRADAAQELLDYAFLEFNKIDLYKADDVISEAKIWFGRKEAVGLVANQPVSIIVNKDDADKISLEILYNSPVKAPVKKGDKIAELQIKNGLAILNTIPLFAEEDVKKLGFFRHIIKAAEYYLTGK